MLGMHDRIWWSDRQIWTYYTAHYEFFLKGAQENVVDWKRNEVLLADDMRTWAGWFYGDYSSQWRFSQVTPYCNPLALKFECGYIDCAGDNEGRYCKTEWCWNVCDSTGRDSWCETHVEHANDVWEGERCDDEFREAWPLSEDSRFWVNHNQHPDWEDWSTWEDWHADEDYYKICDEANGDCGMINE